MIPCSAMVDDATTSGLSPLLDLQAEDSAMARLQHRKAAMPEAQRLAEVNEQLAELDADIEIATKQQAETTRAQDRLEGEISLLVQKLEREESRMYSGGVSNPKELSSLQAEVAMLKKKRSSLEDELLELMVQKEQSDETLSSLRSERDAAAQESTELTAKVSGLTGEIDRELESRSAERDRLAAEIPSDVLALYERIREQKGGVGAAALEDGTCQGCHTKLPAREVERLRSEGGIQRCDNCRRILVVS